MDKKKLAHLLSVILGPLGWLPVLFLTVIFRSGLDNQQLRILLPSVLLLEVIIPLLYLHFAPRLGFATAWDLPKRRERYPFLSLVFITNLISLYLSYRFGTMLLFNLGILLTIGLLVFFVITFIWQISLHAGLNTFGAILINFLFGWSLPWLYLTIPIIFWARQMLNKHTMKQLLIGALISGLIALGGLSYFGYW